LGSCSRTVTEEAALDRLTTTRRSQVTGLWEVVCAACGPLARYAKAWPAIYDAKAHEQNHRFDEEEATDGTRQGGSGPPVSPC